MSLQFSRNKQGIGIIADGVQLQNLPSISSPTANYCKSTSGKQLEKCGKHKKTALP